MSASTYRSYKPTYTLSTTTQNTVSSVTQNSSMGWSFTWENTLNYKFNINSDHHFDALIGLFNIFGSLYAGYLGTKYKMKYILAFIYASRALMIIIYLLSPKTELTFYIFSIAIGFTWLATVPPTAGIVGKLFGTKYLATLFGLTLLSHQIGGFFGAYLGGLFINSYGNFSLMWYLDIFLAIVAALANLPIKEGKINKN